MTNERTQRQIDRLLEEAEVAAAGRDWPKVLNSAHRALAFDPENTGARNFMETAERMLQASSASSPVRAPEPPHERIEQMLPAAFQYALEHVGDACFIKDAGSGPTQPPTGQREARHDRHPWRRYMLMVRSR